MLFAQLICRYAIVNVHVYLDCGDYEVLDLTKKIYLSFFDINDLICCIIDNDIAWCDYWSWELLRGVPSMNYRSCEHSGWLLWMAHYGTDWASNMSEPWRRTACGLGSMNSVYYLASCLFMGGVKNCTQATNVGLSLNGLDLLQCYIWLPPQDYDIFMWVTVQECCVKQLHFVIFCLCGSSSPLLK